MPVMVKSRIPQIAASLDPRVKAAVRASAEHISTRAKVRAPVESGALRDAIHVEDADDGAAVVAGDNDIFYGHFVELGTTTSPPRPFLIPAAEESIPDVKKMVSAALRGL